jgi:hypothetical protein
MSNRKSIDDCLAAINSYVRTSSDEFALLGEEIGRCRGLPHDLENLGIFVAQSREQRKLFSVMIGDLDEASHDSDVFDTLLDTLVEVERIWCLCEIFQFSPGKMMSLEFARWLYETGRKDVEMAMTFFEGLDKPETYAGSGHSSHGDMHMMIATADGNYEDGYWSTVYLFAVQGSLDVVWDLLCLHSEFPRVDVMTRPTTGTTNDVDFASSLKQILLSHPYLSFITTTASDDHGGIGGGDALPSSSSSWSRDIILWKERIQHLQQKASSLQGRIPEINKLLRILEGNHDSLLEGSKDDWLLLTLGKLLYMHSPPLTRANLEKVVDSSISSTRQMASSSSTSSKENQQNTVKSIIGSEVGVAIRHIHGCRKTVSPAITEQLRSFNLVFTLPSVFLCYMLIHGCNISDLNEPLKPQDPHSGYFEQLIQSSIQEFQAHRFSISTIVNMINISPQPLAVSLSTTLLPSIGVDTDVDAYELANVIRGQTKRLNSHDQVDDDLANILAGKANNVEIARGIYWVEHKDPAKAIEFFAAAGDMSRSIGVIDMVMRRFIRAMGKSEMSPIFFMNYTNSVDITVNEDVPTVLREAEAVLSKIVFFTYLSPFARAVKMMLSVDDNVCSGSDGAVSASEAIRLMCSIIVDAYVPQRYLLFVLEVMLWAYESLWVPSRSSSSKSAPLSKIQVYRLIEQVELQMNSFNATNQVQQQRGSRDYSDDSGLLRKKLLGMLSKSCIEENTSVYCGMVSNGDEKNKERFVPGNSAAFADGIDFLADKALY